VSVVTDALASPVVVPVDVADGVGAGDEQAARANSRAADAAAAARERSVEVTEQG
jgi:hypothetical protein